MNYIDYSDHFGVDGFNAFISYRDQDYANLTNRKVFTTNLGFDVNQLVIPNQVHSKRVKMVDSACLLKETDGVVSNVKNVVLSIQVADCIPLFLFNPISHQFGMIHSGWRGTAQCIGPNAIHIMETYGDNAKDVMAIIGPSIGQCCFEVGPEVTAQFDSTYSIKGKNDRMMLDLKNIVKDQMLANGLLGKNILVDNQCTYCEKEYFFSYRRDGQETGRMVAISGWRQSSF
ncbi:MAG: peptidoglycan editing factor PgeF [Candidatus Neomarinimicrobiota bacterium]|nr:peptidoglycan editing factor PgeF [Candidatus Neomarinimicrobiota bacterium]